MVFVRFLLLLVAASLLNACTFFFDVQDGDQTEPAPDSRQKKAISGQVYKTAGQMKLAGGLEISDVGPNVAQSGPEKWTVCLRSNFPAEPRYFTFFLKGETVVNWRPSVINDRCEDRRFSPLEPG